MSGHSKWSTIKHKKAKEDAKRGKAFTKLIKEITVSARQGGGNPASNAHLRVLTEKAKSINMPNDNVVRAIKKGTGELPGTHYEEILYEAYGPHGSAILLEALTDNKNRTVAELRRLFSSQGGNLAETGSVSWMFEKKGVIRVTGDASEETLLNSLIDYDLQDINCDNSICSIICSTKILESIKKLLQTMSITIESAEVEWVAKNLISISDAEINTVYDLLKTLDDHDDIKNVFTNLA